MIVGGLDDSVVPFDRVAVVVVVGPAVSFSSLLFRCTNLCCCGCVVVGRARVPAYCGDDSRYHHPFGVRRGTVVVVVVVVVI